MTAPDLLPCPFCGCTTIKLVKQDEQTAWHECDWCQAVGPIEDAEAEPPQGWSIRTPAPISEKEATDE